MRTFIIISPGFPNNEEDTTCLPGIQQFVLSCKKEHADLTVIVIAMQYPFTRKNYLWHGIEVIGIGGKNKGGAARLLTWVRTVWHLQKTQKKDCVGVLSLWLHESALVGKWYAGLKGLKHFIWMQGQDAKGENSYVRRIDPRPDQLVAISHYNSNELFRHHGIRPAHIIENGVNPEIFPAFNTRSRSIDITGVGSLIPLKKYNLFIRVIRELVTDFPEIRCLIIGDGLEKSKLQDEITKTGLTRNIILKGRLEHPEVLNILNDTRILFHPSEYEGNSTVILEALYSGCQVVSALNTSYRNEKNIFYCDTPEKMKQQLKNLLVENHPAEKTQVNTIQESARKMLSLFEEKPQLLK